MTGIQFKKAMYLLLFHPALSIKNRGARRGGLLNRQKWGKISEKEILFEAEK